MKKYGLLIGIFVVLLILGILFFINKDDELKIEDSEEIKESLELVEYQKTEDEYYIYMEGKIKNNDTKDYSYIQVIFTTYDEAGNVNGNCTDNVNILKENETWKFKAMCMIDKEEIYNYKLKDISGF